jgi:hypothetical protein
MTKDEMQEELRAFLDSYAESITRIYGRAVLMPENLDPTKTNLWKTGETCYEYGVNGCRKHPRSDLGRGTLPPEVSDADAFLHGLSSEHMQSFMDEDAARFPFKCQRVINAAIARHVLDGGLRDLVWEPNMPEGGYLTIGEVALLADMDERSVRNAAAKTNGEGRLLTEAFGKRSYVEVTEARRWLNGRKGFVATTSGEARTPVPTLSAEILEALAQKAAAADLGLDDYVRQRLLAA